MFALLHTTDVAKNEDRCCGCPLAGADGHPDKSTSLVAASRYLLQTPTRLAYRDDLVAMRLQERNCLHALQYQSTIIQSVLQRLETHIQYLNQQITALDQEIEALLSSAA